jgi:hypothetical protein
MYIPLCSLNVFTPIDSIRTMVFNWEQNMCLSICFHKDNIKETCVWNAREKQGAFLENKKKRQLAQSTRIKPCMALYFLKSMGYWDDPHC